MAYHLDSSVGSKLLLNHPKIIHCKECKKKKSLISSVLTLQDSLAFTCNTTPNHMVASVLSGSAPVQHH